jgi:hypothetical protein
MYYTILITVGSDRHLDRIVHTGLDEVDGRAATDRNDKSRLSNISTMSELNRAFVRNSFGSSVPS